MHGDFSQLTYSPLDRFSSVLRLQGRVDLDADSNENTSILLHYMRTLASDLIGPYGGPLANAGFEIGVDRQAERLRAVTIGFGRYYVDGLLVENYHPALPVRGPRVIKVGEQDHIHNQQADVGVIAEFHAGLDYYDQPDAYLDAEDDPLPEEFPLFAYLKVWERLVTAVEEPDTREVALGAGGPDSSARTQVVWQVILTPYLPGTQEQIEVKAEGGQNLRREILVKWLSGNQSWLRRLGGTGVARLRARAQSGSDDQDPCALPPFARYRGAENQLYRVEVHVGGELGDSPAPTFKWSRDNGSVVFPIESINQSQVVVTSVGRDDLLSLEVGQWVEVVDDAYAAAGAPAPLYQVQRVEEIDRRVTLDRVVDGSVGRHPERHPFLRRWDHTGAADDLDGGAIPIAEASPGDAWIELEDGVQVQFERGPYRPGDYWLIPARTETGDVIWPVADGDPDVKPPDGPTYHFAPLALITEGDTVDLRCIFDHLACKTPAALADKPEQVKEPPPPPPAPAPAPRPTATGTATGQPQRRRTSKRTSKSTTKSKQSG